MVPRCHPFLIPCLRLWKHRTAICLCAVAGSLWKCIDIFKARQDSCCVEGWEGRGPEGKGRREGCSPMFLPSCFISFGSVPQVSPSWCALTRNTFWMSNVLTDTVTVVVWPGADSLPPLCPFETPRLSGWRTKRWSIPWKTEIFTSPSITTWSSSKPGFLTRPITLVSQKTLWPKGKAPQRLWSSMVSDALSHCMWMDAHSKREVGQAGDAKCPYATLSAGSVQAGPPVLPVDLQPYAGTAVRVHYWKHSEVWAWWLGLLVTDNGIKGGPGTYTTRQLPHWRQGSCSPFHYTCRLDAARSH